MNNNFASRTALNPRNSFLRLSLRTLVWLPFSSNAGLPKWSTTHPNHNGLFHPTSSSKDTRWAAKSPKKKQHLGRKHGRCETREDFPDARAQLHPFVNASAWPGPRPTWCLHPTPYTSKKPKKETKTGWKMHFLGGYGLNGKVVGLKTPENDDIDPIECSAESKCESKSWKSEAFENTDSETRIEKPNNGLGQLQYQPFRHGKQSWVILCLMESFVEIGPMLQTRIDWRETSRSRKYSKFQKKESQT